jgi:glycosyltransferase involved in cell wall biosynthesis
MDGGTVSVVIPTYNRINYLPRALDSVAAQTRPVTEIIVVDDGSTDGTTEYIRKRYPDVNVIRQANHGVSHARNTGIHNAAGHWVAFLDSDDAWMPDKMSRQFNALAGDPGYRIVHSNEIWIRRGVRVNQKKKHRKYGGHIFTRCLPICAISPSASLIHRSVFAAVGLFDESLPACEDYDMWLRICSRYPVLYLDDELIIKYGGHADQLSRQFWGMDRFRIRAIANLLDQQQLADEQRKAAVDTLLGKIDIYLQGAAKRRNSPHAEEFLRMAHRFS